MKKLIPAICMTLLAAAMFATSTFAWFSMNTTVKATGMQVTANTDNAYLIISTGTTLSGSETSANANVNEALYPVKPVDELSSLNINSAISWGTATSNNPNDANKDAVVTPLDSGADLTKYVLKQSFMVGIIENSGTVEYDLKLKTLTISDTNDGITVVVVCGSNLYSHNANVSSGAEVLATKDKVTTTGVQVDVYIYIDGSNENVKMANAANLGGSITLEFTIAS